MYANKQKQNGLNPLTIPGFILKLASWIYFGWMFIMFPLYFQNNYRDMGNAKFFYFRTYTTIYLSVALIAGGFYLIIHIYDISWKSLLKRLNWLDRFVLLYMVGLMLSYFTSDYRDAALWGANGWFMGVLPQISFILIYFFISRFFSFHKTFIWIMLVPSSLVYFLALLHRFSIDPLGMYNGLPKSTQLLFLSTIGQATWYSSYLCVLLPIGIFLFWYERGSFDRRILGAYCALGFATLVTQNSDSAFIAAGLVFLTLFCCSFESNLQFKNFLQLTILCIGSMRIVGIFQLLFASRVPDLESLSFFMSKHPAFWVILALLVLFYVWFIKAIEKDGLDITHCRKLRNTVVILVLISIPAMLGLIFVTTSGSLPESLAFLKKSNYLNFDNHWGNGRGFTWKYSAQMFREFNWHQRLFGCGPDSFVSYTYPRHAELMNSFWGNSTLSNAHNEWLNIILTLGIFGGLSYVGLFLSGIVVFIKNRKDCPLLLGIACCLLSYMGHNLFCYQQAVGTSLIFILLGLGRSLCNTESESTTETVTKKEKKKKRIFL